MGSTPDDARTPSPSSEGGGVARSSDERPGVIEAVPVRHPGRWVAVAVIGVLGAMLVSSFVTNPKWDFPFAFRVMNFSPVLEGLLKGTIIAATTASRTMATQRPGCRTGTASIVPGRPSSLAATPPPSGEGGGVLLEVAVIRG